MNRSVILFAALLLTCNLLKAQTEKGNQTIGIDFNSDVSNTSSPNSSGGSTSSRLTDLNIGPTYSYFIADNWDIALNANYGSSVTTYSYDQTDDVNPSKVSSQGYSATLSLRRYFMYKNKIGLSTALSAGLGHSTNNVIYLPNGEANNSTSTTNYFEGNLTLSLVYYPSKHVGLSLLLGNLAYQHYAQSFPQSGNTVTNDFSLGFKTDELALSLFYVFGGKG